MNKIKLSLKLLLLFLFVFYKNSYSQHFTEYDDLHRIIKNEAYDKEKIYNHLLFFHRNNSTHAHSAYQLGVLSQEFAFDLNPILNYNTINVFLKKSKYFLKTAQKYINKKEVKENAHYYYNIPIAANKKQRDWGDIIYDIEKRLRTINNFEQIFNKTIYSLKKCSKYHNQSQNIWKNICSEFNNETDLLLSLGKKEIEKINLMQKSYDSCMIFLKRYLNCLKSIKSVNFIPKYKIKKIKKFKFDGINVVNFNDKKITIYNYSEWAKNTKMYIEKKIIPLRKTIENTNSGLDIDINQAKNNKIKNKIPDSYKFLPDILTYINIFDYNSLPKQIFKYKQKKIDFLQSYKSVINNENYNLITGTKKLSYLLKNKYLLDSLNKNIIQYLTDKNINKYKIFFEKYYNKKEGIINYIKQDDIENQNYLDSSLYNFKQFITNKLTDNKNFTYYKGDSIPLFKIENNNLKTNKLKFFTLKAIKNNLTQKIIGGFSLQNSNKQAFIAMIDHSKTIKWIRKIPTKIGIQSKINCISADSKGGCFFIISEGNDSISQQNTLIHYNKNGIEILRKNLKNKKSVRYLSYNQLNNKILIAFKSKFYSDNFSDMENLEIYFCDALGETLWEQKIKIAGKFQDILTSGENYMVFMNVKKVKDHLNRYIDLKSKTNTLVACLDKRGFITRSIILSLKKSYNIFKCLKINSNTFNLLGFYSNKKKEQKLIYFLINNQAKILFSGKE